MTDREVLRQGRDALVRCASYLDELPIWHNAGHCANLAHAAIAAADAVLAQPEPLPLSELHGPPTMRDRDYWSAGYASGKREVLAAVRASQPEQEPVAQCEDNDSPWLICKTCAAAGKCAKTTPTVTLPPLQFNLGSYAFRMHVIEWRNQVIAAMRAAGVEVKT